MQALLTKSGRVRLYGLACGYVETRDRNGQAKGRPGYDWDDEAYLRMEARHGVIFVNAAGRYLRKQVYAGLSVTAARRAMAAFDLAAEHEAARAEHIRKLGSLSHDTQADHL